MKHTPLILLIALAMGALGYGVGQWQAQAPAVVATAAAPDKSEQAVYVCPMHSHIVQDHPGACPICGMELVAAGNTAGAANQIHVDTATQQKFGVRLARAEVATLSRDIVTHATLVADESAILHITPNVEGVLTRLHVSRAGQHVVAGQVLYEVSSQELLNLQNEYIDIIRRGASARQMAAERREQNRRALDEARSQDDAGQQQVARGVAQSEEQVAYILQPIDRDLDRLALRLKQAGFSAAMLQKLDKSGQALRDVPVPAPRACVVKEVTARPGMQLAPMSSILQCVDASRAWLEVALYPDQLAWVKEGDALSVEFEDGTAVETRLAGLNPLVDGVSRTVRARLPLSVERGGRLGEYAKATVHAAPREVLAVPKSALMRSGHGSFVMRAMGKGHFMPVKVVAGIETAEHVAIIDGLVAGDEVAVNGQFLLDAAASIADAAQRMQSGGAAKVGAGDTPKKP